MLCSVGTYICNVLVSHVEFLLYVWEKTQTFGINNI